jgi:hypothetical protein
VRRNPRFTFRWLVLPCSKDTAHLPSFLLPNAPWENHNRPICQRAPNWERVEGGALRPICKQCMRMLGVRLNWAVKGLLATRRDEQQGGMGA